MKFRKIICLVICCMLLSSVIPVANAAGLRASIATGPVTLNGQSIDNSRAKYPLLLYKNITYFPMTYYLCRFLQVETDWDGSTRTLYISRAKTGSPYVADTGGHGSKGTVSVSKVTYPVVVNGVSIDNKNATWPLLNYNDITYFPLTWEFAVESFGWEYAWDAQNGLRINSTGSSIIQPSDEQPVASSKEDSEAILSATRGFATAAWDGSPESMTVEVQGQWNMNGVQTAIWEGLEDFVAGSYLEGRLIRVTISESFQLPTNLKKGMELQVPYQATYQGNRITLSNGSTFAPTSSTEELVAIVRLS